MPERTVGSDGCAIAPERAKSPCQSLLQGFAISAGMGLSLLSIIVALSAQLEMYGDGSIFSYAVAAREAWAFHWHNISGRVFTYIVAYIPAEWLVGTTGSAMAGIALYGFLFFAAPLLGLIVTLTCDTTRNRTFFTYACGSTACLCPFVFGAPTEMWMAHSVFWPALTIANCSLGTPTGALAVFGAFLALAFTHEGALVLSAALLFCLWQRGWKLFARAAIALAFVLTIWALVKLLIRPDAYIAPVMAAAAYKFIDLRNLEQPAFLALAASLLGYVLLLVLLRRLTPLTAAAFASFTCAAALAVYWLWFDQSVLAEARYKMRTLLLIMIPVFGLAATLQAMTAEERRRSPVVVFTQAAAAVERMVSPYVLCGALVLTVLLHVVETAKFVSGWLQYKSAVRALATSTLSDPQLGSPFFVSSHRIESRLNRLAWNSTTPFLSVLMSPGFAPKRLVVDPDAGYFWLSCKTAKNSEVTSTELPQVARRLVRIHACLHR